MGRRDYELNRRENASPKRKKVLSLSAQLEVNLSELTVNDYDKIAAVFDAAIGNDFANIIFDPCRQLLERLFGSDARIRHLDIACGTGEFLVRLAQVMTTESFGIDLSRGQIQQAMFRARREKVNALFRVGDIRSVPFPRECNVVTCNMDALNHLPDVEDWQMVFRKVRTCLHKGGVFLFDVNTPLRLIRDWHSPEVIIKPDVTYVQCGLPLERSREFVRRKLLMQIFSRSNGKYTKASALVQHLSISKPVLFRMLAAAGFANASLRRMRSDLRARHIFMRNRIFVMAKA